VPIAAGLRASRALPPVLGPLVMLAAIGLRMWAAMTLGRFYTRTLRTAPDQIVVRDGPYRFVRHPGYLGTLLMWTAFGLSTRDWLIGAVCGHTDLAELNHPHAERPVEAFEKGRPRAACQEGASV